MMDTRTRTTPRTALRRVLQTPLLASTLLLALGLAAAPPLHAQGLSGQDKKRARRMVEQLQKEVEKRYYDPTFRGVDLEALREEVAAAAENAPTEFHMFAAIAQYLLKLDDSHTVFYPPAYVAEVDYGFQLQFVGDTCYIVELDEESDGAHKGLGVGDAVLALDGVEITRENFWILEYLYTVLTPRTRVGLMVRSPGGTVRPVEVFTKVTQGPSFIDPNNPVHRQMVRERHWHATRDIYHHVVRVADSVHVWKMPLFAADDRHNISDLIKYARRGHTLILDLRGNGGGAVKTELQLLSRLFDREVEVATVKKRKETETLRTKPEKNPFLGKLIVLVDSRTASAAEMVARVVQLEGRGTVIGDRTAGAVMVSELRALDVGFGRRWVYLAQITVGDVLMSDGNRLEKVGVTPDELIIPTGEDLAAGRDPVMARALELAGIAISAEDAGQIYEREKR